MLKPAVRRSACDQCRAKRVRCLRAQDSMVPCARCCHIGARCVTGAPGHPGRPPKQRLADGGSTPRGTAASPADVSSSNPVAYELQQDLWDISAFFGSPLIEQSLAPGEDILPPANQLSSPLQLQGLFGADDEVNAMLHMGGDSRTALDMDVDRLLDYGEGFLPSTTSPQCLSVASSLARFIEEIDQRITTIDAYYSNPSQVLQHCKDGAADRDVENPAALLLTCTKELIEIVQSLTPAAQLDALSTETVLLVLSSYLALMRLFDCLFHRVYQYLCQVAPESYESIKVKSVLRIGGVSSLQDMPLKRYAIGVLDAIQGQVRTLEHYMGIPAEYCLSAASSTAAAAPGIFSRADRARSFWAIVAQEDVKSRRGSKSYVESIRASIKESMAFLED